MSNSPWLPVSRFIAAARGLFVILILASVCLQADASNFTVLHSFTGPEGGSPSSGLTLASDGNFYGTTPDGGTMGFGTIYKLTPAGDFGVIYNFDSLDGAYPNELLESPDGNFYGTVGQGPSASNVNGIVFSITTGGVFTLLHTFHQDAIDPSGGLILGTDGNFYGLTRYGGAGFGTIYKTTAAGEVTVVHEFGGNNGSSPEGSLLQALDGSLYGVTSSGISRDRPGAIFQTALDGELILLHIPVFPEGYNYFGGLIQAEDGNFYGTAREGGANLKGSVYRITSTGILTTLHDFDKLNGASPQARLLEGADGNLYGTTAAGGAFGGGTVFQVTLSGEFTTLHDFNPDLDGGTPLAGLIQDNAGNLIGTTSIGGNGGLGTIFSVNPTVSPTPTPTTTPTPPGTPTPTSTPSPTPTATPSPTPTPPYGTPTPPPNPFPVQLGNLSTRLSVGVADNVLIGGFIITGSQPKPVIVRAIGPSLSVPNPLLDPALELHDSSGAAVATNDNWRDTQEFLILATGVAPTNDKESAIVMTLNPGAYTTIVQGTNATTGVALVEVYDLDQTVDSKLANVSTRGFVGTDDNVMIGGTIVLGTVPANTLIRAIGPSLTAFGIVDVLADPTLELHDGNGAIIATNDNWKDTQQVGIEATTIPPTNDAESAIIQMLSPGAYTAIVRGKNNTTGVALAEVYQLGN